MELDITSFAGASGGAMAVFLAIKIAEVVKDILMKREQRLSEKREPVDDETKVVKLNGTKCDSHKALEAKLESMLELKEDVKEVSNKLDKYSEQIFDRLRVVEKDVAVLQAKG